jgi:anti-repressor protein
MHEVANIFNYGGYDVRTIVQDGEPWFVAADVCAILDITNVGNAITRLDKDEKDAIRIMDSIGREQNVSGINESGLYSLVMTSRKTEAKAFKKWVTGEVLPAIRKHGKYEVDTDPQAYLAKAVLIATQMLEEQKQLVATMEPKAKVYDEIVASTDLIHISEAAKVLGYPVNKFRDWLRQCRFLLKRGSNPNVAAAGMVTQGLMVIKEYPWDNGLTTGVSITSYFTQKGMLRIKEVANKFVTSKENAGLYCVLTS